MRLKSSLAVVLAILAFACGGGGGGNGTGAPSQLAVVGANAREITLSWVALSGTFDGYELEGRTGSDAFQKLHTGLIPNDFLSLILTFTSGAPDSTTYAFRLRTAKGTTFSAYSNEAAYLRGPNQPGRATATFHWASGAVHLAWDRNTTGSDGLLVERAACDQYGNLAGVWLKLPTVDPLASTYVDTGVSPNLYYTYRLTNLKGAHVGQASVQSIPAFTGFAPVSWVNNSYDPTQGGVTISWGSSASTSADGVLLERSDCDANGLSLGNWTTLPVPAGYQATFLDRTVMEGGRYTYRVSNLYGSTATIPCQSSYSVSIPLLPPVNLQVVATPGGMQLTWQNRSSAANQVVVRRIPAPGFNQDIAILSPSTSSYLDPLTSLGYYTYTVAAKNSTQEASSNSVSAATLNPPGALALIATPLNLPLAADAAIRSSGSWAFATAAPFGILSNGDPWPAYFPGNASHWGSSILKMDFQGRPHAVYAIPGGAAGSTLLHAWYDGTSWKSESVATVQIPNSSANQGWVFQLDTEGNPHIILDHQTADQPYGGATASLSYLHRTGGTWVEESLSSLSPSSYNFGTFHLSLDGADTPHLLLGNWSTIIDYARTGSGTWSASTLPITSMNAGWYDFLDGIWVDSTNGWVFYEADVNGNIGEHGLWALQMKGGAWQTPVLLGSRVHDGASTTAVSAISPDKTRVAILFNTSAGVKCYHLSQEVWQETLVAPYTSGYPWLRFGFDGSQKIHVLRTSSPGYIDYHE